MFNGATSSERDELLQEIKDLEEEAKIDAALALRGQRKRLDCYYPDEDSLQPDGRFYHARHKYPKQLLFFRLGATEQERAFMAANRVGKTEGAGGYETALHLTGRYPSWWEGHRFTRPINALCAGLTTDETRDVMQAKLVGRPERRGDWGTGLIPYDAMDQRAGGQIEADMKTGVRNAIDVMPIRHVSGGWSLLQFRSCDQGREKFQGTERDLVWFDEEPDADVYEEGRMRTMTTKGIVILTFTPLKGLSEVALRFLPDLAPQAA